MKKLILALLLTFSVQSYANLSYSDTLMYVATKFYKKNHLEMSRILFDSCILLNPKNDECFYYRGKIAYHNKNYKIAKNCFKTVLAYIPEDYAAWNLLGLCYQKQTYYDSAELCFKNAVKLNSKESQFYANWAKNEELIGNLKHSEGLYNTANFLDPEKTEYVTERAKIKHKRGNSEEAIKDLKEVIEKNPEDKVATQTLKEINAPNRYFIVFVLIFIILILIYFFMRRKKS